VNGGTGHWPILLIELLLVMGGVLAFAWWQLRDLDRERRETARRRAAAAQDAQDAHDVQVVHDAHDAVDADDADKVDRTEHPSPTAAAGATDSSAAADESHGHAEDPSRPDRGA
jgi:Tfp pilus assembly protein PilV